MYALLLRVVVLQVNKVLNIMCKYALNHTTHCSLNTAIKNVLWFLCDKIGSSLLRDPILAAEVATIQIAFFFFIFIMIVNIRSSNARGRLKTRCTYPSK